MEGGRPSRLRNQTYLSPTARGQSRRKVEVQVGYVISRTLVRWTRSVRVESASPGRLRNWSHLSQTR